jgi:hypothetical protein
MASPLGKSWTRNLAAGAAALALLAVAGHFAAGPLLAQATSSITEPTSYRFRLAKVDELVPRRSGDKITEIIPLGSDNLFMVAVKNELVVFRVETGEGTARNRRLGTIPLLRNGYSDVREIVVLDDKRSFLIRTDAGVAIYSVTKQGIVSGGG